MSVSINLDVLVASVGIIAGSYLTYRLTRYMQEERDIFNEYQQIVYSLFETLRKFQRDLNNSFTKFCQALEGGNSKSVIELQSTLGNVLRHGSDNFVKTYEGYRNSKLLTYYPEDVPLPLTFSSEVNLAIYEVYEVFKNVESEIAGVKTMDESQIKNFSENLLNAISRQTQTLFRVVKLRYARAFSDKDDNSVEAKNYSKNWLSWSLRWFFVVIAGIILISLGAGMIIYQKVNTILLSSTIYDLWLGFLISGTIIVFLSIAYSFLNKSIFIGNISR